jgi:hypothetical protein
MANKQFVDFAKNLTSKALNNPSATAGWIGKKKYGESAMRKLTESPEGNRSIALAKGIATVIETNVSLFGKGKAAQVIESFTNDLMENEGSSVLQAFNKVYGTSPAMYSIHLSKMYEDDVALNPEDDKAVSTAIGQIASNVVANPSIASQPTSAAIAGADPAAKTALQKIAGDTSSGQITNVGQLVKAATDKLDDKPGAPGGVVGEAKNSKISNAKNDKNVRNFATTSAIGNGKPKTPPAKRTITKEQLLNLGESKLNQREHPSFVMGVGGYYAGLPKTAFSDGSIGCDPIHSGKGWDAAFIQDRKLKNVGESKKSSKKSYEEEIQQIASKKKNQIVNV